MRSSPLVVSLLLAACDVPPDAPLHAPLAGSTAEDIEEIHITAEDVAGDEILDLVLSDDVVFVIDAEVALDGLVVVTDDARLAVDALVGDRVAAGDGVVLGTDAAMAAWAGLLRKPGCWWEYVGGQWVRYCIA